MAYQFYCTGCGEDLQQDKILFDFAPVLSGSTEPYFALLRFFVSQEDIEQMFAAEPKEYDSAGSRLFCLDFPTFRSLLAKSMNSSALKDMTYKDVVDFAKGGEGVAAAPKEKSHRRSIDEDDEPAAQEEQASAQPKDVMPASVRRFSLEIEKNEAIEKTKGNLRDDFKKIILLFGTEDATITFSLIRRVENNTRNPEEKILVGYEAEAGTPRKTVVVSNARVCPKCGRSIFENAGTAPHKTITMIGRQGSSKTSIVVALADYAKHAAEQGPGPNEVIWKDAQPIAAGLFTSLKVIQEDPRMIADMEDYRQRGLAPLKTPDAKNAPYCLTLRIGNGENTFFISVTDLPGEVYNERTGEIKTNDIKTAFPQALTCDAFLLCYDASDKDDNIAKNMCECAMYIQKERIHNMQKDKDGIPNEKEQNPAPMMVFFSKCPEIEDAAAPDDTGAGKKATKSIKDCYCFKDEYNAIRAENSTYMRFRKQVESNPLLKCAYFASLRGAPIGFPAPNKDDLGGSTDEMVKKGKRVTNKDEQGNIILPCPKNIDKLLTWLLKVSGCIPCAAKYTYDPKKTEKFYASESGFRLTRTQYRPDFPEGKQEGLARCYLFENPGKKDIAYTAQFDDRWNEIYVSLKIKIAKLLKKTQE